MDTGEDEDWNESEISKRKGNFFDSVGVIKFYKILVLTSFLQLNIWTDISLIISFLKDFGSCLSKEKRIYESESETLENYVEKSTTNNTKSSVNITKCSLACYNKTKCFL